MQSRINITIFILIKNYKTNTMKSKIHELKNLKTNTLNKSIYLFISILVIGIMSCKKEDTTPKEFPPVDIDGNVYDTIRIGTQVWMKQNLRTTRYNDGTTIPNIADNTEWINDSLGAYSFYNHDASNDSVYGKLYNWYAVNTGKLAPSGWHVPDSSELQSLIDFLGGKDVAGGALKATTLWNSPNTGATNSSGFTWYPAGNRYGFNGVFVNFGFNGFAWTSSEVSTIDARLYNLGTYIGTGILKTYNLKSSGCSVRCLKD